MSNVPSIWQCLPNLQLLLFMHKLTVVGHMDQKKSNLLQRKLQIDGKIS